MALSTLIGHGRRLGRQGSQALVPFAPVLARLVYGQAFVQTGFGKLANFDRTVQFFTSLGIPGATANAAFVGTVELLGGICLLLGLGTRVSALLLLSTMLVAILTAHGGEFVSALLWQGDTNLAGVLPVPFLVALVWLIAHGPGRFALDHVLFRTPVAARVATTIPAI